MLSYRASSPKPLLHRATSEGQRHTRLDLELTWLGKLSGWALPFAIERGRRDLPPNWSTCHERMDSKRKAGGHEEDGANYVAVFDQQMTSHRAPTESWWRPQWGSKILWGARLASGLPPGSQSMRPDHCFLRAPYRYPGTSITHVEPATSCSGCSQGKTRDHYLIVEKPETIYGARVS